MTRQQEYEDLLRRCSVCTGEEGDRYVGVKVDGTDVRICFPLGYRLPETLRDLQNDIKLLIQVIDRAAKKIAIPGFSTANKNDSYTTAPIREYALLIEDYLRTGTYLSEHEVEYKRALSGIVSWSRTIAQVQPVVTRSGSIVYLDMITRKNNYSTETIISKLHEYCLYESFKALGWLYTSYMPQAPQITRTQTSHIALLKQKISNTYNDRENQLLDAMIRILENNYRGFDSSRYSIGTERFEYVWEYMIEEAFGISDKQLFFPKAMWTLKQGGTHQQLPLEPDSIMKVDNCYYVLDAKYYKYGLTKNPAHLPGVSSISKQIIYGQYAAIQVKKMGLGSQSVYNAFVMPGDLEKGSWATCIGIGDGTWVIQPKTFERVVGLLVDVRYLLRNFKRISDSERCKLAYLIKEGSKGAFV